MVACSVAPSRDDLVHPQQATGRFGSGFKRMVEGVGGQPRSFDGSDRSVRSDACVLLP